jgi:hypothetical protein
LPLYVNARSVVNDVEPLASALAMADDGREIDDELIDGLVAKSIGRRHTPISDHLHHLLRDLFRDEMGDDTDYADVFDRAEVILDAIASDMAKQLGRWSSGRGGYGRYTWRYNHSDNPVESRMLTEAEEQGEAWAPVLDGLFGGSSDRAIAALKTVSSIAARIRSEQWG